MFERVYTPAVYTLGAMSSVWTSQYPDRHHSEVSFSARLPKDRLTLAELLSAQGIHTGGLRRQLRGRAAVRLRPRLRGLRRGLEHAGEQRRRLPHGRAALAGEEPRPSLLRLRPLPRAALPVRPRAALRHEVRARRPDPEGGEAHRAVLPGREPGPPAVQRGGARAPRAALRRQPGLRRPGDRGAAPGDGGRGPLGEDGRDRGRRPRRGAPRARLDRPQRPPLRAERARAADRPLPEGDGARRACGSRPSRTCSTSRRRSPTSSACAAREAPTARSRAAACCP